MRALIPLILALQASLAAAQLYSWKDADGKIHYSDQPPTGAQSSRKVTVPPPNTYSGEAPRKEAATPRQPAAKPAAADADKGKPPPPSKQELCDKAKADLSALEEGPRRGSVAGGRFRATDGEQRDADEARLRQAIADNCS